MSARRRLAAGLGALVCVLAGCAPHRVALPALDGASVRARFETLAGARRAAAGGYEAEVSLWLETGTGGRLPAVDARLALARPDAARLRIASPFGTALDIGARGDTLAAYLPPRREGLELGDAADSLGLGSPGGLAYRAWSGEWDPPAEAWDSAIRTDSVRVLSWREGPDSLAAGITAEGQPGWVEAWRPGGTRWSVHYREWTVVDGVSWPALTVFADDGGRASLTARTRRARVVATGDRGRVAVRIPSDARRWTLDDLRRALAQLGDL